MRARLNEEWRNQIKPIWEMQYKECHELLEKTAIPDESEKSQWEHLSVRASFWGVEDMKADILTFLEKHPHHYCARMSLAIHDLDQKVPGADQRIEELLMSSAEMLEEALAALERHYLNSGNKEKILSMPTPHEFWMKKIAEADRERNSTPIKPSLGKPLCVESERMEFEKAIRPYGSIHIVRACFMQCETYPEFPHHILLVTLKFPLLKYASEENKAEALHALLQVWNVRGSVLILNKDSAPSALIKQIEAIENSLLFQR
jgi:hypothetical protein